MKTEVVIGDVVVTLDERGKFVLVWKEGPVTHRKPLTDANALGIAHGVMAGFQARKAMADYERHPAPQSQPQRGRLERRTARRTHGRTAGRNSRFGRR